MYTKPSPDRAAADFFELRMRQARAAVREALAESPAETAAANGDRWISQSIGFDSRPPPPPATTMHPAADFTYRKVTVEEAREALADPPPATEQSQHDLRQRTDAPEMLSLAAVAWLARTPAILRPVELPRRFPRILNRLCSHVADPAQWDEYLADLLIGGRDGSREGFPPQVATELARLFSTPGA